MRPVPKFRQNIETVHQAVLEAGAVGITIAALSTLTKLSYAQVQEATAHLRNKERITSIRYVGNPTLTFHATGTT